VDDAGDQELEHESIADGMLGDQKLRWPIQWDGNSHVLTS